MRSIYHKEHTHVTEAISREMGKKSACFILLLQRVHFGLFTASEACSSLLSWPLD